MKSPAGIITCSGKRYLLALAAICVPAVPVFALHMTEMPANIQTKAKEARERTISLKLPLLQPAYHWTFMSREDFLSGKLLLRTTRRRLSCITSTIRLSQTIIPNETVPRQFLGLPCPAQNGCQTANWTLKMANLNL